MIECVSLAGWVWEMGRFLHLSVQMEQLLLLTSQEKSKTPLLLCTLGGTSFLLWSSLH